MYHKLFYFGVFSFLFYYILKTNNICIFIAFVVPRLFKEKRGDMVFGFLWCVMRGSEFVVGTL